MQQYKIIEWTPEGDPVGPAKAFNDLNEVANLVEIGIPEIEWAIETGGRCDSLNHTIWEPYEPSEEFPHDPWAEATEPDGYTEQKRRPRDWKAPFCW